MTNQSREAFEKWAVHCGLFQKTHGPIGNRAYDSSYTEEHWQTWQAALSEGRRIEFESKVPINGEHVRMSIPAFGKLLKEHMSLLKQIRNICENSNPTYKTRVDQILALLTKSRTLIVGGGEV